MSQVINIGVGRDAIGWYERVLECLETRMAAGAPIRVVRVDPEAHDWQSQLDGLDALIWNPFYMGPVTASFYKEKVYFIEEFLNIRVLPSYRNLWHFESKVAQSYLFEKMGVPRPRTIVSFDYHDAMESAPSLGLPVVAKKSFGASGSNVLLLRTERDRDNYLERAFGQQMWNERKIRSRSPLLAAISSGMKPWLRAKLRQNALGLERHGYVLLQEFVPGNDGDQRVGIVGRHAMGASRLNRPNDFRASGSGRDDYDTPIRDDVVEFCYNVADELGVNIIGFDIIFREGNPIILEMSYGMPLKTQRTATQHWIRHSDGRLVRYEGHVWPQDQWVELLLDQMGIGIDQVGSRGWSKKDKRL